MSHYAMQGRCDNEECLALFTVHSDEETTKRSVEQINDMQLESFSQCMVCADGTVEWNSTDPLGIIADRFARDGRYLDARDAAESGASGEGSRG